MPSPPQVRAGVYGRQSRGKAKSISEQLVICTADVNEQPGWTVAALYKDGTSASRYARKQRDDWERVLADIEAGKLDVLVLWESSRGDRKLTTWSALLDLCRDRDVKIRITTHDHTYDLAKRRDWESLAQEGIGNASDSAKISVGVRRGHAGAAAAGRPSHGRAPYGYWRTYNPATGELIGQEPDPKTAPIVREIITRFSRSEPVSSVAADLDRRGIPTPNGGARWYPQRVRDVALNVAYIGKRLYNGQVLPGIWPAIVEEDVWYAARRVLTDPARVTTLPGKYKHLLSYLATCSECGAKMDAARNKYRCSASGCVSIRQDETDALVTRLVLGRLSRPDLHQGLRQAGEEVDREILEARTEAAELRARLDDWRRSAAIGQTSPESLAVVEAELSTKIKAADRRADRASLPVALRQILEPGGDVRNRWDEAPMPARRDIVRALATIVIGPSTLPSGSRTFEPERLGGSRWNGEDRTWADYRSGRADG